MKRKAFFATLIAAVFAVTPLFTALAQDSAYIGARDYFENLGAQVLYEQATHSVEIRLNEQEITFDIGANTATVDGEVITLSAPSKLENNRAMLPTDFASLFAGTSAPVYTQANLTIGYVDIYDFGGNKLHAYASNDPLGDVCYVIETDTALVGIEVIPFEANVQEWKGYLEGLGKPLENLFLSYHPNGMTDLDGAKTYATQHARTEMTSGSIKGLIDSFVDTFGDSLIPDIPEITNIIGQGTITVAGIDFIISEAADAYEIEIPALNSIYVHMLGSDVHSIVTSPEHITSMIAELNGYIAKDYALVLTSHYVPETLDAVRTKIAYLEKTLEIYNNADTAEEFEARMLEAFPGYSGVNYLEISMGALYAQ